MSIKKDGFTVSTADHLRNSLAQKLVGPVDAIRDIHTRLGARPYRVTIVRTRFSGPTRGAGVEVVVHELEVLPTPMVVDMRSLSEQVTSIGMSDQGTVQLQQISGRYTEETLLGVGPDGSHVAPNECVYYEIEFFRRDGRPSERRRFTIDSVPTYNALGFQWQLTLMSSIENRTRDRSPVG